MEQEQKVPSDLQQERQIFLSIWGSADFRAGCPKGTEQEEQPQEIGTQSARKAGQCEQSHTSGTSSSSSNTTSIAWLFQGITSQNIPVNATHHSYQHLGATTAPQHLQLLKRSAGISLWSVWLRSAPGILCQHCSGCPELACASGQEEFTHYSC